MSESKAIRGRIAILWWDEEAARRDATPETSRFKAVFAALAQVSISAEPRSVNFVLDANGNRDLTREPGRDEGSQVKSPEPRPDKQRPSHVST